MEMVELYFNKLSKCVTTRSNAMNAFYSTIVSLFCLALIFQHSFQGWKPWQVVCACMHGFFVCTLKFWLFSTFDFSKERLFIFQQLFYSLRLMSTLQRARDFVFLSNAGLPVCVEAYYGSCESSLACKCCFSRGMEENWPRILYVLFTHYWVDGPFRKIIIIITVIRSSSLNRSRLWPSSQYVYHHCMPHARLSMLFHLAGQLSHDRQRLLNCMPLDFLRPRLHFIFQNIGYSLWEVAIPNAFLPPL